MITDILLSIVGGLILAAIIATIVQVLTFTNKSAKKWCLERFSVGDHCILFADAGIYSHVYVTITGFTDTEIHFTIDQQLCAETYTWTRTHMTYKDAQKYMQLYD